VSEFLTARGFEHFQFKDETQGGALVPLIRDELAWNVYSLSPRLQRRERYA